MGESEPILRSRKNDAESSDVIANIIGFGCSVDPFLIGGNEAHTLCPPKGKHERSLRQDVESCV